MVVARRLRLCGLALRPARSGRAGGGGAATGASGRCLLHGLAQLVLVLGCLALDFFLAIS